MMTRRRIVLGAVAAAVLVAAIAAAFAYSRRPDAEAAGGAPLQVVREDFRSSISAAGVLEAASSRQMGPPSIPDFWDYNLTWMANEGETVKAGQPVLKFDPTKIADSLREREADLETATKEKEKEEKSLEVEVKQLELDLVEAKAELERASLETAAPEGIVSRVEARELRLAEDLAKDKVEFLRRKIEARRSLVASQLQLLDLKKQRAQQRIDYYRTALAKFDVPAPTDGVIVYVRKRDGNRWEVGESVWMLAKVLEVADLSTLRVNAQILEVDASRVQPGQPVTVTVDAIPGRVWKSQVGEVGRLVRQRSWQDRSKVFDCFIPLEGLDPKTMRPGMSVRVDIEEVSLPGALTIPLAALSERDGSPVVIVAGASGREERPVKLGPRNGDRIVVTEGLEEGQRLVAPAATPSPATGAQGA